MPLEPADRRTARGVGWRSRMQLGFAIGLIGSLKTLAAIENGADPQAIESEWQEDLAAFQALRAKYLLYR